MASVTITFTAAQGQRIANALGTVLGLVDGLGAPRAATAAEYSDWLRGVTKRMVQGQELQDAQASIVPPADLPLT